MNEKLQFAPLKKVRPNDVALRAVDKESEKFLGIVDSVHQVGILNPVVVHEVTDKETGETVFGLIDGLHRFTAAQVVGLDVIPVHVITANESQVLEAQIIGNLQKVDTRPIEYSHQLHRLLAIHPLMTATDAANKLGVSITWVSERLKLVKLREPIQKLVEEGKINVTNACALANLPPEEQDFFVDRAVSMPPNQFAPMVSVRAKEIRDAKRTGRKDEGPKTFTPVPFLQNISVIKGEMEKPTIGSELIKHYGITSPLDAWNLAIKWVLHFDDKAIEAARQKHEERKQQLEAEKEARKAEKQAAKEKEALEIAAQL